MVTIRDVSAVSERASVAGTADLRDTALLIAERITPAGSPVRQIAEVAAALILVAVGEDPTDAGLSLEAETLALADRAHREIKIEQEPPEVRVTRRAEEAIERLREERDRAEGRLAEAEARAEAQATEIERMRAEIERLSKPISPPEEPSAHVPPTDPPEGKPRKK